MIAAARAPRSEPDGAGQFEPLTLAVPPDMDGYRLVYQRGGTIVEVVEAGLTFTAAFSAFSVASLVQGAMR
jgi:hypothetical protein